MSSICFTFIDNCKIADDDLASSYTGSLCFYEIDFQEYFHQKENKDENLIFIS